MTNKNTKPTVWFECGVYSCFVFSITYHDLNILNYSLYIIQVWTDYKKAWSTPLSGWSWRSSGVFSTIYKFWNFAVYKLFPDTFVLAIVLSSEKCLSLYIELMMCPARVLLFRNFFDRLKPKIVSQISFSRSKAILFGLMLESKLESSFRVNFD